MWYLGVVNTLFNSLTCHIDSIGAFITRVGWSSITGSCVVVVILAKMHKKGRKYIPTTSSFIHFIGSFFFNRYSDMVKTTPIPKKNIACSEGKIIPSVCFMGGGHLWSFALGIGHYIHENYDTKDMKFLASSCGMFGAVPLALGLDPYEWCKTDWQKCIDHYNGRHWLLTYFDVGCLNDTKYFYYQLWDSYLPDDAHVKCSGKLFLSVTLYPSLENRLISEFESRDQLIWSIISSMCLPIGFIGDFPIKIPNIGDAIDGGFSNDAPCLDSYTITASALHNASDISSRYLSDELLGDDFVHNPLTFVDIIKTPSWERVWQVARVGELAAEHCPDFERHEWKSRLKSNG